MQVSQEVAAGRQDADQAKQVGVQLDATLVVRQDLQQQQGLEGTVPDDIIKQLQKDLAAQEAASQQLAHER